MNIDNIVTIMLPCRDLINSFSTFHKPVLRKVGSYWVIGYRRPIEYGGEFFPILAHDTLEVICHNYDYVLSVMGVRGIK